MATVAELEKRVEELEAEVARLSAEQENPDLVEVREREERNAARRAYLLENPPAVDPEPETEGEEGE